MEDNKNKLPDETSKDNEKDNVTPAKDNSTSATPSPTEPSKDDDKSKDEVNVQQAIQKHAELREKAEQDKAAAEEKLKAAEADKANLLQQIEDGKQEAIKTTIISRIEKSNLPEGLKQRIAKDPVKWLTSNADEAPQNTNVDELTKFVSEKLADVVSGWEKELGVTASPRSIFVDSDNASIQTPNKMISQADLKKMSPYQIQDMMRNNPQLKEQLLKGEIQVSK